MEIIYKKDVLNQIEFSQMPGEMNLIIESHEIGLSYSNNGMIIAGTKDGVAIQNLTFNSLFYLLDKLTDNQRYEIKMNNKNSEAWQKIRISDEELKQKIEKEALHIAVNPQYKGFWYLCEILYEICRKHIAGDDVNIFLIIQKIAKSHSMDRTSLIEAVKMVTQFNWNNSDEESDLYRDLTEMIIRNFSHTFLDYLYSSVKTK